jgi:hypothetical protein
MTSSRTSEHERRRTGRRPGPTKTREQILPAARESFAKRGSDATSLRAAGSAAEAGRRSTDLRYRNVGADRKSLPRADRVHVVGALNLRPGDRCRRVSGLR